MTKLALGDKARAMLSSFGKISESLRVRSDYLFAKNNKISGIYVLPNNEVSTDEPYVLHNALNFLQVYGMFNEPSLEKEGIQLVIKDSTKKASYLATDSSMAPERKPEAGENLFDTSQDIIFTCMLEEKSIKDINDAVSAISATNLNIQCKDGQVIAVVENTTTENFFEIPLSGSSNIEMKFDLGDISLLNLLYKGIYAAQCKKAAYTSPNGQQIVVHLIKFVNKTIQEVDGKLFYLSPIQVVK